MHERVVEAGHDVLGNPQPKQELPKRRPVNLGAKPEDPDDATQDPEARLDDDVRVGFQDNPAKQREGHEGQGPREGRLDPSASAGPRQQQQPRAEPRADQGQGDTARARVDDQYAAGQRDSQGRDPQRLAALEEQSVVSVEVHRALLRALVPRRAPR